MGIKKVNKLYNIVVSSNIFHLQPELCKSVHKCNFGEFLNFRNFWTNDVTDDVIGVVGSIFWVILRVYIYDVIISKFHQNRSVNKKSTGVGVKEKSYKERLVNHSHFPNIRAGIPCRFPIIFRPIAHSLNQFELRKIACRLLFYYRVY